MGSRVGTQEPPGPHGVLGLGPSPPLQASCAYWPAGAPLLVQLPQPDPAPLGKELMESHDQPHPRTGRRRQMAPSSPRLQGEV